MRLLITANEWGDRRRRLGAAANDFIEEVIVAPSLTFPDYWIHLMIQNLTLAPKWEERIRLQTSQYEQDTCGSQVLNTQVSFAVQPDHPWIGKKKSFESKLVSASFLMIDLSRALLLIMCTYICYILRLFSRRFSTWTLDGASPSVAGNFLPSAFASPKHGWTIWWSAAGRATGWPLVGRGSGWSRQNAGSGSRHQNKEGRIMLNQLMLVARSVKICGGERKRNVWQPRSLSRRPTTSTHHQSGGNRYHSGLMLTKKLQGSSANAILAQENPNRGGQKLT